MHGWRERSPVRCPTPVRPGHGQSRSHASLARRSKSSSWQSMIAPRMEYQCGKTAGQQTQSLTLRAFTDGLPDQGDLRNFLRSKRNPPREKRPGVIEHVVQDYRYPQTCHEIQMVRQGGNPASRSTGQLEVEQDLAGASSAVVDTLGSGPDLDTLRHKTSVFMRNDIVDGDQDDKNRFKEYVKKRPITSDDFNPCSCGGKGVQVWMRLCGCGCRCARCRAVVRYKHPDDDAGGSDDDDDDPLGWN